MTRYQSIDHVSPTWQCKFLFVIMVAGINLHFLHFSEPSILDFRFEID